MLFLSWNGDFSMANHCCFTWGLFFPLLYFLLSLACCLVCYLFDPCCICSNTCFTLKLPKFLNGSVFLAKNQLFLLSWRTSLRLITGSELALEIPWWKKSMCVFFFGLLSSFLTHNSGMLFHYSKLHLCVRPCFILSSQGWLWILTHPWQE